jgi:uncharacterized protein YecT (DUF1311 family)
MEADRQDRGYGETGIFGGPGAGYNSRTTCRGRDVRAGLSALRRQAEHACYRRVLAGKNQGIGSVLNAAYKALQARIDTAQRQPLLTEQRLWVQYRDANCGFYGAQEGCIRQVQAAECMRSMTEDRSRELEKAMKFD